MPYAGLINDYIFIFLNLRTKVSTKLVEQCNDIFYTKIYFFKMIVNCSVPDPNPDPNPDPPDPHVFGPPGSGSGSISQRYGSGSGSESFYHHAKIVRKTLLLLFFDSFWLFIFEKRCKCIFKSNKQKKNKIKKLFFVGILKVYDENSRIRIRIRDPDPDPLVRGMDPRIRIRIRIHTKMSWIQNTG